ncbi:hypothetical protein D3C84_1244520 [compost metagenome]
MGILVCSDVPKPSGVPIGFGAQIAIGLFLWFEFDFNPAGLVFIERFESGNCIRQRFALGEDF